jgi:hypothetical protein
MRQQTYRLSQQGLVDKNIGNRKGYSGPLLKVTLT